jgi:hypothetical protein
LDELDEDEKEKLMLERRKAKHLFKTRMLIVEKK